MSSKRELLLLRHGKSDWSVEVDDFRRPLTERGILSAQKIGLWMRQQGLQPDLVLSSPAERALATTKESLITMAGDALEIQQVPEIYEADLETLLAVLAGCPESAARVLLVGHNPGLDDLALYLSDRELPRTADGKLVTTATLVHFEMPEMWVRLPASSAALIEVVRPRHLPDGFPFPDLDGKESRPLPAHCYRQSAVIPYRVRGGQLELLLVGSRRKKRWIVPKGIVEYGMSPAASAEKEAVEEAGVRGRIGASALGKYAYRKWGGTCEVEVFPLEVTDILPEAQWPEYYRGRRWVTPEDAAIELKNKTLKKMVNRLEDHVGQNRA